MPFKCSIFGKTAWAFFIKWFLLMNCQWSNIKICSGKKWLEANLWLDLWPLTITGAFSSHEDSGISGPFVFLRLSNVPRHLQSPLMDADGGSVWHYRHSSACFRGAGHVVCPSRPHSASLIWPRPPPPPRLLQGVQELSALGGAKSQFSPWVNTSQHASIPPSPKVTLSALQLARSLFLSSDMELGAAAVGLRAELRAGTRRCCLRWRFGSGRTEPHLSLSPLRRGRDQNKHVVAESSWHDESL